ncbi:oxidoreductase FAD/NAD(P)-binding domain protein [Methylobacterium sp. 4-46]|uniref:oxidoreductase n=1 Tax=Methylobacterium sp. (strain 4-46) TaxID=426117 RepID=UPI000152E43F|nr:oxidoreductase [Methylobacterium sp. 4-46]ACA16795.1 oxidoreductase FAD/NAD(P)-binding domain protein [Methylobacterium sp. 4-46]
MSTRPRCSLVVNGKTVRVATGDTPLDAALTAGVAAGHDGVVQDAVPRLPQTGRTRPRLGDGATRPIPAPSPLAALRAAKRAGTVLSVAALSENVREVVITVSRPLDLKPGLAMEAAFAGFPARPLCPTQRLDGSTELNELVFHLRRDGPLGAALGGAVGPGHGVRLRGPVGGAAYRPGTGRLVLVSAETGFAPIWAIARAARYLEPDREMVLVAGARDADDLYMRPALAWLRATGIGQITLVASANRAGAPDIRPGPIPAHLPPLGPADCVYAAGVPDVVRAVERLSAAAGASCAAIPFLPAISRARRLVSPGEQDATLIR